MNKITETVHTAENVVKSEVKALETGVKSLFDGKEGEKVTDTIKAEDIDELLDALPAAEEEVMDVTKTKADEVLEKAAEEIKQETED